MVLEIEICPSCTGGKCLPGLVSTFITDKGLEKLAALFEATNPELWASRC